MRARQPSVLLAFAIAASGPAPVAWAGEEPDALSAALQDDAARRQEMHNSGQVRFDAGDYVGALEVWLKVHEDLPPGGENEAYRAVLLQAIGAAALKADETGADVEYLRRVKAVFDHDLEPGRSRDQGGISNPDQLRPLLETQRKIDFLVQRHDEEAELPPPEPPELPPEGPHAPPEPQIDESERQRTRSILLAGGVMTGVGLLSFAGMGVALYFGEQADVEGEDLADVMDVNSTEFDSIVTKGERANQAAIATGVIGGVGVATGAALLAVGIIRHRKQKQATALVPVFAPGYAGLSFGVRF